MLVLYLFTLFIYLHSSFINGDIMFPSDIEHTLFGNITTLRDLFINENGERIVKDPMDQDNSSWIDDYEFTEIFQFEKNASKHSHDLGDYNVIMEKLKNMTILDHNLTRRAMFTDYYDRQVGEYIEEYKRDLLVKINIQFTMHVRYEVGKALTQREKVRSDRRYKIGYLFNRLRRLQTEQMKIVAAAIVQNNSYYDFELSSMIRMYERVVHLDVDMRDTARDIKELFDAKEEYDFYIRKGKGKKFKGDGAGPGKGPLPDR